MNKRKYLALVLLLLAAALPWGIEQGRAAATLNPAVNLNMPNFAYSPPLRKFVDSLPGLGTPNNLTQQIPIATPDTLTYPGSDYYEISLVEYHERMHSDLPAAGTQLRGYVQTNNGTAGAANTVAPAPVHYLGPLILATKNRPVRIKFTNALPPTATGGNLFLPVDTTIMGAGEGPCTLGAGGVCTPCNPDTASCANYTQNRATIHLHGGIPPWISDGTALQWITPATEVGATPYLKGASQQNVPDMWYDSTTKNVIASCAGKLTCTTAGATTTPAGVATFYWTNQQSGRLMFYHDHAVGMTSLNVYAGEAAGYLLVDPVQEDALAAATVPGTVGTTPDLAHLIPLVIQDKTFVPSPAVLAATDPLWQAAWGGQGNLWFPHVYMPNQDPIDLSGANPLGRWDYGPWFWPVFTVVSPYPPAVSHVPEAFMDTPVVNGTAYPYVNVQPAKYRLQILNASNDRMVNLQFHQADPAGYAVDVNGNSVAPGTGFGTEVKMIPAAPRLACGAVGAPVQPDCVCTALVTTNCFPAAWAAGTAGMIPDILDSRPSGIPDPTLRGPAMIQIGTEGGILPGPVLLPNTPVGFEQNKRNIVVLNVLEKTLMMAPAERADVVVDFTNFAGKTVILYNDSPAPVPASDPRYDFYTGNPDFSATSPTNNQGGAPSTLPGFGPNTRTIMQFRVAGSGGTAPVDDYNPALLSSLTTALPTIFKTVQDPPVVPESAYNALAYTGGATTDKFARIQDLTLAYTPYGSTTPPVTVNMKNKTIQELFDPEGRMNATLGVELPFTNAGTQTTVPLGFIDPPTETLYPNQTQLWKITHNGVDTHGVHFHLVNVQVVNRVGWDGAIRPTDPNELGWKDTVRMNPLEDIIVAMRAKVPTFPFPVPESIRPLNPSMPVGSTFASFDPLTGAPVTVTNAVTNFGHEYTWHCHILGHEENDMMRPMILNMDSLLYVVNPTPGIWQWELGNFTQINTATPQGMAASGGVLYADMGTAGIWKWDLGVWTQINTANPTSMLASGTQLYATYGGALWLYNGATWTNINPVTPTQMVASGTTLYATLASGLWKWDGSVWTRINTGAPQNMVVSGTSLYATFSGAGLWQWNGTVWTKINTANPTRMLAEGSLLYADYGGALWQWNGTAWTKINTATATTMLASGTTLYATFSGAGLWQWNGTAWTKINTGTPQNMVVIGSVLYADFGASGLWKYQANAWTQLSPINPVVIMAGF